jgi:serine/threonine-protein kinase
VFRPLLAHVDYDPLLLAWRRPLAGGPRRLVVLKQVEMPAGHPGRQRALEEVRLAAHLHHPNITRVLGLAEDEGTPYVVWEHMRGAFLGTLLSAGLVAGRKTSPAFAAFVAAEAAQALDDASHCEDDRGRPLHILHRAVSPMTLRLGHGGRVKLCNFGAAFSELLGRMPTPPRVLRGNLAYAAPELLHAAQRGPTGLLSSLAADARADVFSLGLVLLEMLAGHHPLDPPDVPPRRPVRAALRLVSGVRAEQSSWASLEVLADRLLRFGPEAVERAAPKAPARLKAVVHRALCLEPARRYPSAAELRDDLRAYLRGLARPYGASEMAAEMATLLSRASALKRPQAHPVELGVLPWPKAFGVR